MRFKKGMMVIKLPLENTEFAQVIKITKADKKHAYGSDGNQYHQSNGRCSGRCVMNKKDIIQLPPFGYSAEEEAEKLRNIAIRNKEIEQEILEHRQRRINDTQLEEQKRALESFKLHKTNWNKARRIKTPLGQLKIISFSFEGQYKNEINHCSLMVWIKQDKDGYIGYGAILMGLESDIYPDIFARHFSIETRGKTIPEVVGNFFLKIKK